MLSYLGKKRSFSFHDMFASRFAIVSHDNHPFRIISYISRRKQKLLASLHRRPSMEIPLKNLGGLKSTSRIIVTAVLKKCF